MSQIVGKHKLMSIEEAAQYTSGWCHASQARREDKAIEHLVAGCGQ